MNNFTKTLKFCLIAVLLCAGNMMQAQIFTSSPGEAIPDINCDATNEWTQDLSGETMAVLDGTTFGIETVDIDITHTWDSDLDITLIAPDGTEVELSTDNGGSGDDYTGTTFDCNATTSITSGTAPFTGSYIPEGDLGTINNGQDPNGVWTIRVCDDASGDEGTLNSWGITFGAAPCTSPMAPDNDLCDDAIDIALGSTTSGTTVDATTTGEPAFCGTSVAAPGVWYTYTSTESEHVTVDICGAPFDSKMSIYSGSCASLICVKGEDDDFTRCGENDPSITFLTTASTSLVPETYYIYINGFNGQTGTFDLSIAAVGLPVDLVSFDGKTEKSSNMLMWETASEENTEWHIIERSIDGRDNWVEIGKEKAAGFTTEPQSYMLEDMAPVSKAYYRLRSVDFDGYQDISELVYLERATNAFDIINIFPNPTKGGLTVNYEVVEDAPISIRMTDMLGKTIAFRTVDANAGINFEAFDMSQMADGVYFINILNGETQLTKRILKN